MAPRSFLFPALSSSFALLVALGGAACGDDGSGSGGAGGTGGSTDDAVSSTATSISSSDGGSGQGGSGQGGSGQGGSGQGGSGGGGELASTCDAACQAFEASVDFGGGAKPFERAHYGLAKQADGTFTVTIEISKGGDGKCPSPDAPVPDYLLTLTGVPLPETTESVDGEDGLVLTLFDFAGDVHPDKLAEEALTVMVTPRAADLCTDCVGKPAPSDADGFFAFDLEGTWEKGSATGKIYATHCDSLDTDEST